MLPSCVNLYKVREVVYCHDMAEKPPTVAVLNERLGTAIKLGAAFVAVTTAAAAFLLVRSIDHGEKLTAIPGRLDHIDSDLRTINDQLSTIRLRSAVSDPTTVGEVSQILSEAKSRKTIFPEKLLGSVGTKLISYSEPGQPEAAKAWRNAVTLLDYRSGINATLVPRSVLDLGPEQPTLYHGEYNVFLVPGTSNPASGISFSPHLVPPDKAAIAESFDHKSTSRGDLLPEYVAFGGGITLDNSVWRNIVAKDALVVYHGGAVALMNVYFVDCKFQIDPTPNGREFTQALLDGLAVNLSLRLHP